MGSIVIQNSVIVVRQPMKGQENIVTAHGRQDPRNVTGLVIQNCKVVPEKRLVPGRFDVKTYLGRPWKAYSRAVIMESELLDKPAGWRPWNESNYWLNSLYFGEFKNHGPRANSHGWVNWKGYHEIKNRNQVAQFTAGEFLKGRFWIQQTGFPFHLGMMR